MIQISKIFITKILTECTHTKKLSMKFLDFLTLNNNFLLILFEFHFFSIRAIDSCLIQFNSKDHQISHFLQEDPFHLKNFLLVVHNSCVSFTIGGDSSWCEIKERETELSTCEGDVKNMSHQIENSLPTNGNARSVNLRP